MAVRFCGVPEETRPLWQEVTQIALAARSLHTKDKARGGGAGLSRHGCGACGGCGRTPGGDSRAPSTGAEWLGTPGQVLSPSMPQAPLLWKTWP